MFIRVEYLSTYTKTLSISILVIEQYTGMEVDSNFLNYSMSKC